MHMDRISSFLDFDLLDILIISFVQVKDTQAWNFFNTFFVETESLWTQEPVTRDFWKSYSIRLRYSTFKDFCVFSASDKIRSAHAQHIFHDVFKWVWFPLMLSMRENWLLVGWAWAKIGYLLAEHARKLTTHKLSIGAPHAFSEFFLSSTCHSFICHLLLSLSNVLCLLSHVLVLCLPTYVPCLMSLILVSRSLSPVSWLCSLSPVLCPISCGSAPCFPTSVTCQLS